MENELMSDALDDFAADLAEQPDQFARTRTAYATLLQADAAFDAWTPRDGTDASAVFRNALAAAQKVREAIADDTCAYNDRNLILSLHEPTVRRLAAQLTGLGS